MTRLYYLSGAFLILLTVPIAAVIWLLTKPVDALLFAGDWCMGKADK